MNIKNVLPTVSSFSTLLPIAEQAEVKLSFWGSRYVCVNGYEDTISMDALAARVFEIIKARSNFGNDELADGKVLEDRITRLYEKGDELIDNSNCFTKCMYYIVAVVSVISNAVSGDFYSIRYQWNGELPAGPITLLAASRRNQN